MESHFYYNLILLAAFLLLNINQPCYEYAEGLYHETEPNFGLRYSPPLQIVPFLLFIFPLQTNHILYKGRDHTGVRKTFV